MNDRFSEQRILEGPAAQPLDPEGQWVICEMAEALVTLNDLHSFFGRMSMHICYGRCFTGRFHDEHWTKLSTEWTVTFKKGPAVGEFLQNGPWKSSACGRHHPWFSMYLVGWFANLALYYEVTGQVGQTVNLTAAEVAALPLELSRTSGKGAAAAIDDLDENPPDPESNNELVIEPAPLLARSGDSLR